jgi:hypothetical protein
MPVYLRRFWINKVNQIIEEDKQRHEKKKAKASASKKPIVKSPL